MATLSVSGWAF